MIDSIQIKGFKKLSDITLEGLRDINYLVGPNGCGKSSILEAIIMLGKNGDNPPALYNRITHIFGNPKDLFRRDALIKTTGHNENASGLIDSYKFQFTGGRIIAKQVGSQIATITKGFILTTLRDITYFNDHIDSAYSHSLFDLLRFNLDTIDSENREGVIHFLNSYFFNTTKAESKIIRMYRSMDEDNSIQLEKEDGIILNIKSLSTGQLSLLSLYFSLFSSIEKLLKMIGGEFIIAIDEPENSFHPDLQKEINSILKRIVDEIKDKHNVSVQFIVSTHSPFIIKSIDGDYTKVYLIKNGGTVRMDQLPGGKKGFSDSNCVGVASMLLGAGLHNYVPTRNVPELGPNKIRIIYCEGSNAEADAIYYNIIFPEYDGIKNHFISCGGGNEVLNQWFIGKETGVLMGGPNISIIGVVDRSNSSAKGFMIGDEIVKTNGTNIFTDAQRDQFLVDYPGMKMLKRREIENYLYDSEISTQFEPKIEEFFNEQAFLIGEIKTKILETPILSNIPKVDLARKIVSGTKVYEELAECIFS